MLSSLFTDFLIISFTTSFIILALKMLYPLLNKNYTAKWKCWAWIILAVRLLLPFNFSVTDSFIQIPITESTLSTTLFQGTPSQGMQLDSSISMQSAQQAIEGTSHMLSPMHYLTLIWISGVIFFLIYHFIGYYLFKKRALRWSGPILSDRVLVKIKYVLREMEIKSSLKVLTSGKIPNPMLVGIKKPVLFLPHENYNDEELEFILRHELVHYRRHDIVYKLLLLVVLAIHWFNPFVWLMVREASREIEIYCDDTVVREQSLTYRKKYCEAILSAMQNKEPRYLSLSTNFSGGKHTMKKRFMNILNMKKKRNGIFLIGTVLILVGILAACTTLKGNDTSNGQIVDEAIKAAETYKITEYNVKASQDILSDESIQKRNEELKPFFTEEFVKKAVDTRYTLLPLQVANKQQLSLKPENLKFSLSDQKKDIVELKYTVDLVLLDQEGNESNRVSLEGILTLFDVNGQWLVQGDRYDSNSFNKLINQ